MAVSIKLNTLLAGSLNYFAGMNAERHSTQISPSSAAGVMGLTQMEQYPIRQNTAVANLTFDRVPAGEHFFCVRGSGGQLRWRSPALQIRTGNEQFSFHIVAIALADSTFDADTLTSGLAVPKTFDIDGLDEDLTIATLDLAILSRHLDIDGEGTISKGNEWSLLKSDFRFDYDFNLEPVNHVPADRFVRVVKKNDISLQLSNPLTSIGSFFMRDKIERMIRRAINNAVNGAIQKELRKRTSSLSSSQRDQVTATINSIEIVRGSNGSERCLQLSIDVSIPSAAVTS